MKVLSRALNIGALVFLLSCSSCNLPAQTPTAVGTILPTQGTTGTAAPTVVAGTETPTLSIPVTGAGDVSLQCEFCVNDETHAVLLLPESAAFLVSEPVVGVNCITAQVVGDQRILFCRGDQETVFTLNVCFDGGGCLQYPVTLAACPLAAQQSNPTAVVLTPADTGITPTSSATSVITGPPPAATTAAPPLATASLPPVQITTAAPLPTQTVPPAATTTALPPVGTATVHGSQSRVPATHLPRTALSTPDGFLRWYFAAVWNERNYQDLWDNYLTPAFKARPNSGGGYEDYAAWWSSVQRVDVNSVSVLQNDGTHAWVRVNLTFTMNDGRIVSNQEYDYALFYEAARQTWMFDYLP
jgi:hypothetical protein